MKKALILTTLLVLVTVGYLIITSNTSKNTEKMRVCPDILVKREDLYIGKEPPKEYYIIDGDRYEMEDFDLDWVVRNCDVEVEVVS